MSLHESAVIHAAGQAAISRYVGVSAVAFLVWDMIIHLGDEVEYIWQSPSSWVKWTYLFIRHWALLTLGVLLAQGTNENNRLGFTERTCYHWIIAENIISFCLVVVVEGVLFIRIYAIYGQSKIILYLTGTLFVAEFVTAVISTVKSVPLQKFSIELGCVVTWVPAIFMASWIASLTFQTVLFILTLIRWSMSIALTKQLGRQSILFVFVRDGIWAYALMFVVLLLNLLMFKLQTSPLAPLCFKWALSVMSFTGSHVLLNLRRMTKCSDAIPPLPTIMSTQHELAFSPRTEISTNAPTISLATSQAAPGKTVGGMDISEIPIDETPRTDVGPGQGS